MSQTFSVRVVSPPEWDRLTKCPHMDDGTMGYADASRGKAYVRDTHVDSLNRYLVNHEFSHLLESHATDACECGYRHKSLFGNKTKQKGGDAIRTLVAAWEDSMRQSGGTPTGVAPMNAPATGPFPLFQQLIRQQAFRPLGAAMSPLGTLGQGVNEVEGRMYGPQLPS